MQNFILYAQNYISTIINVHFKSFQRFGSLPLLFRCIASLFVTSPRFDRCFESFQAQTKEIYQQMSLKVLKSCIFVRQKWYILIFFAQKTLFSRGNMKKTSVKIGSKITKIKDQDINFLNHYFCVILKCMILFDHETKKQFSSKHLAKKCGFSSVSSIC